MVKRNKWETLNPCYKEIGELSKLHLLLLTDPTVHREYVSADRRGGRQQARLCVLVSPCKQHPLLAWLAADHVNAILLWVV